MLIGGLQKFSTIDYPGIMSAVVFTTGCNFECWFCHNKELLDKRAPLLDVDSVLGFLQKRKGFLEGVVVSGGEPTIQEDLGNFLRRCRAMGYKTKLDTNGSHPEVLAKLLSERLVNYVAVDLKTLPRSYGRIGASRGERVIETVELLRSTKTPFEVRTTVLPDMGTQALRDMMQAVGRVPLYALQVYNPPDRTSPAATHDARSLQAIAEELSQMEPSIVVRAK